MFTRLPRPDRKFAAVAAVCAAFTAGGACAAGYPEKFEFGKPATQEEIAKVAIAIDAEGRGLPPGKGNYAAGKAVYERSCIACHGAKMKNITNLPNMPSGAALQLIGGRGTLNTPRPVVTVESYWPYATTLFDYIRRAMPFQAPGTLTNDEVYAVSAYILGEANIVLKSMALDAKTLPQVQMPNRDGFIPDARPEIFR